MNLYISHITIILEFRFYVFYGPVRYAYFYSYTLEFNKNRDNSLILINIYFRVFFKEVGQLHTENFLVV